METTSYFIGIKIKSTFFVNLFNKLRQYIQKNNLKNCIELQNILSLHVTLYYLPQNLSNNELTSIKTDLNYLNKNYKNLTVTSNHYNYFKHEVSDSLCYLGYLQSEPLQKINTYLRGKYKKNKIPDNQYTYLPHTSLFKIINPTKFSEHKDNINSIIEVELKEINQQNIFDSIFLFAVNSNYHPEIQLLVV